MKIILIVYLKPIIPNFLNTESRIKGKNKTLQILLFFFKSSVWFIPIVHTVYITHVSITQQGPWVLAAIFEGIDKLGFRKYFFIIH